MNHLVRAAIVLVLVVASLITLRAMILQGRITVAEFALQPAMQASNIAKWATQPPEHAGSLSCAGSDCHEDTYDLWVTSSHGSVACESCHGPAQAHARDVDLSVPVDHGGEVCNLCHATLTARPTDHPQVDPVTHYIETTCMACHKAHRPGPPPAITHEVSEGSDCLFCHAADAAPDRAVPPTHIGRTNDICLDCHEEAP